MIRAGAFDEFGETRTRQFWQAQHLLKTLRRFSSNPSKAGCAPPGLEQLPSIPLNEPTRRGRLEWETDLFGFAVSGHPLEFFDDVAWDTYCPVNRLGEFVGKPSRPAASSSSNARIIKSPASHEVSLLADWTGIVETEFFAQTYKSYGLATVRYPVSGNRSAG